MSHASDAPFGARLIAASLATSALLGLGLAWAHRRAIASVGDPALTWADRERLFDGLQALAHGDVACELLLAALLVVGAARYARGHGDAVVRYLSLGAGVLLALDSLRALAFTIDLVHLATDANPEQREARLRLWQSAALILHLGGLATLTAALARVERLRGVRPWWPAAVAVPLLAYPLTVWGGPGGSLFAWLPVMMAAATLGLAAAAARQAGRIDTGPIAGAWARAAAGLERYRDATALRVLVAVCLAVFMLMARISGFSPLVTLGGLCVLGMIGPLIGLSQIAGLVRVADAPAARPGLALALPLLGVGIAAELAALIPIAGFVFSGGRDTDSIRHLDLTGLAGGTQAGAVLATVILLLSFHRLAVARDVARAKARCEALLAVMLTLAVIGFGLYKALPALRPDRDAAMLLFFGVAVALLIAAIWFLVVYLRMLKELADAMNRTAAPITANAP